MKSVVSFLTVLIVLGHGSLASAQYESLPAGSPFSSHEPGHFAPGHEAPLAGPPACEDEKEACEEEPKTYYLWHEPPPACPEEDLFGATVALNQDVFFGFYATLWGYYRWTDTTDFTFYSILWTTPDFSFVGGGQGLWTEVGGGVNFRLMDDQLTINPQLGFLNGTLLSGAARPLAFEGIVPNVTANWDSVFTEAEFYLGYYLATRGPQANDFLHWWANAGIKPFAESESWASIISTGIHFEQLRLTRSIAAPAQNIYVWLGPYISLTLPNDVGLWFGAGWDIDRRGNPDFYKATISYSF